MDTVYKKPLVTMQTRYERQRKAMIGDSVTLLKEYGISKRKAHGFPKTHSSHGKAKLKNIKQSCGKGLQIVSFFLVECACGESEWVRSRYFEKAS